MVTPTRIMVRILMIGCQWGPTSSLLVLPLFLGIQRSNPILSGLLANQNTEP